MDELLFNLALFVVVRKGRDDDGLLLTRVVRTVIRTAKGNETGLLAVGRCVLFRLASGALLCSACCQRAHHGFHRRARTRTS